MELLAQYSKIIEQIAEKSLGKIYIKIVQMTREYFLMGI